MPSIVTWRPDDHDIVVVRSGFVNSLRFASDASRADVILELSLLLQIYCR